MEYLIFYYGTCLMGLVSIVSMLAIYTSNNEGDMSELEKPGTSKREMDS